VVSAKEKVFMKTLGFFCVIVDTRCAIGLNSELQQDYGGIEDTESSPCITMAEQRGSSPGPCRGKLIFTYDRFNRAYLR
jgi:hypothetical protein